MAASATSLENTKPVVLPVNPAAPERDERLVVALDQVWLGDGQQPPVDRGEVARAEQVREVCRHRGEASAVHGEDRAEDRHECGDPPGTAREW